MRRFLIALALITALSSPLMAGDMHGDGAPLPVPSPTPQGIRSERSVPTLATFDATLANDSAEPTLEDVLSAMLSVFGLVF